MMVWLWYKTTYGDVPLQINARKVEAHYEIKDCYGGKTGPFSLRNRSIRLGLK